MAYSTHHFTNPTPILPTHQLQSNRKIMRHYERTEEQIQASRANGSLSQGPVTDEGKSTSSQNAKTHGLLADVVVLPDENRAAFESMYSDALIEFDPQSPSECQMIREMVVCEWRQLRTWTMVHLKHAHAIEHDAGCNHDRHNAVIAYDALDRMNRESTTTRLMERYEIRFSRTARTLRRELQALKKERKHPEYD